MIHGQRYVDSTTEQHPNPTPPQFDPNREYFEFPPPPKAYDMNIHLFHEFVETVMKRSEPGKSEVLLYGLVSPTWNGQCFNGLPEVIVKRIV